MYVVRMLCPVWTLGPGKRLVLWTQGCSKNCEGCISPEMKQQIPENNVALDTLLQLVENVYSEEHFEGITVSGGDPLEQLQELIPFLEGVRKWTDDILVYTGYDWDEFQKTISEQDKNSLLHLISVLIDGPYVENLNTEDSVLRGSSNQNILFFDDRIKQKYTEYLSQGRKVQNVLLGNELITVGIMDR